MDQKENQFDTLTKEYSVIYRLNWKRDRRDLQLSILLTQDHTGYSDGDKKEDDSQSHIVIVLLNRGHTEVDPDADPDERTDHRNHDDDQP